MRRVLTSVALGLLAVSLARGADPIRLRPLGSIYVDAQGRGLREPEGVGCGGRGLAVADTSNGRILTFAIAGEVATFETEIVASQVPEPIRVGWLDGGDLLALDGRSRRIARLTRTGEFRGFLEPAPGDGRMVVARSFAVGPGDLVFVLDVEGARILAVDLEGGVRRSIVFPDDAGFLSDVAVDGSGAVFAIDSTRHVVYAAGPADAALRALSGSLVDDVDFAVALAADSDGRLYVADSHGGGVVALSHDGSFRGRQLSMGWKEGFVRYPVGVCVLGGSRLFLAERGNNRVQMFEIR